jgi:hypothetical protein
MLDPDDGHIKLITNLSDYFDGCFQLGIVETGHHLIKDEKAGLAGDGSGQFKEPLLVQVEITDRFAASAGQADKRKRIAGKFEGLLFLLMCSRPTKESAEGDILKNGHCGKVARRLLHHSYPHLANAVGRLIGNILTGKFDRASGWPFETDDKFEKRTFAGPVGADDGENFPIVGPHCHIIDSGEAAKVLLDLIQFE